MILTGGSSTHPDVAAALRDCRRAFGSVALLSGIVNLLMLAGPLYMLQVYDRVLSSRSVPALVALSIFLVGAYAFQGVLDLIHSRYCSISALPGGPWRHAAPPCRCECQILRLPYPRPIRRMVAA
jgi:ABC-type protease/lipase transport system fused ATPase/permease subunit